MCASCRLDWRPCPRRHPPPPHLAPLRARHAHAGVELTLVDANHCPGAVQILARLPDGRRYIHCGDMRYSPALKANPALVAFRGAEAVYLDTTYCHPQHTFPLQVAAAHRGWGTAGRGRGPLAAGQR